MQIMAEHRSVYNNNSVTLYSHMFAAGSYDSSLKMRLRSALLVSMKAALVIGPLHLLTGHLLFQCRLTVAEKLLGNESADGCSEDTEWMRTSPSSLLPPSRLRTDEGLNLWCYLISPII